MLTTYAVLDTTEAHRLIKRLCAHDEATTERMHHVVFDHLKRMTKAGLTEPVWSSSNVE